MKEDIGDKQAKATRSMARATWMLFFVGALGLGYAGYQLGEIRHQNAIADLTLRQSIRPIAVMFTHERSKDSLVVAFGYSKDKLDRFALMLEYFIENNGEGALTYIGQFSYLSTKDIDFRERLLGGEIEKLRVDTHYSFIRRSAILPRSKRQISEMKTKVMWDDIVFNERFYLYVILLYRDQAGNLYDTEHLNVISFKKPTVSGEYVIVEVDEAGPSAIRERYHYYNDEDLNNLILALESIEETKDHPIIGHIRR